ncbi:MAG TPA: YdeI/OmpD-associated family protein, partial [Candidatus Limnocylindrales bacterium]
YPGARANWDGFSRSTRKQLIGWIDTAKRPATRAARVEETASLAAQGIRANEQRASGQPANAQRPSGQRAGGQQASGPPSAGGPRPGAPADRSAAPE